jgi:hypothetical protein
VLVDRDYAVKRQELALKRAGKRWGDRSDRRFIYAHIITYHSLGIKQYLPWLFSHLSA